MASQHQPPPASDPFELRVTFFHMLRGDAALVECPAPSARGDRYRALIDCGSHSKLDAITQELAVSGLRAACAGKPLDALILTHTDKDHHSKVKLLFSAQELDFSVGGMDVTTSYEQQAIKQVFFSDYKYANALRDDRANPSAGKAKAYLDKQMPLTQYTDGGTNDYLYEALDGKVLTLVNLDGVDNHLITWPTWHYLPPNTYHLQPLPGGTHTIAAGTSGTGIKWSVTLLAANVEDPQDNGTGAGSINAASIVTLITYGPDTILVCGDATAATEARISADPAKKRRISKLAVLQAPHHGSDSSSSEAFVKTTNPTLVVESVAARETRYRLPKRSIVDRYLTASGPASRLATTDEHAITSWRSLAMLGGDNEAYDTLQSWRALFGGVIPTPYALTDAEVTQVMGTRKNDWNAVAADSRGGGFILYRQNCTHDVWQTGMNGAEQFLHWDFNGR